MSNNNKNIKYVDDLKYDSNKEKCFNKIKQQGYKVAVVNMVKKETSKTKIEVLKRQNSDLVVHVFLKYIHVTNNHVHNIGNSLAKHFKKNLPRSININVNYYSDVESFCVECFDLFNVLGHKHFLHHKLLNTIEAAVSKAY